MDIIKSYNEMVKDKKYIEWKKKNMDCFLAHAFLMFDKTNEGIIQFGFYNPKTDRIITFVIEKGNISISAETEIFKRPESKLKELDIGKVKLTLEEAKKIMEDFQHNEYKNQLQLNSFVILQNIDEGQVYNFTYITMTFNTLNVKIDSETGEIIKHTLTPMMDMGKGDK
ncbi:MAG: hypothetical protein ABII01_03465 [Candidatus Woesearchaeota archaeon]